MSQVAEIIRQQIGTGVLMSLGATDLMRDGENTLTFRARILDSGKKRVRIMRVNVTLDPSDTYSITVGYSKTSPSRGPEWIQHFSASDVYNSDLARVLLSLDQVI